MNARAQTLRDATVAGRSQISPNTSMRNINDTQRIRPGADGL
jgi:hypothetical protein